ncbi:MAG: bifunctional oligoribonuclease/PAP phosphatase NrnA [Coriobacteriia bacterium]|nr:bifunctional oligoribonuclease/PAP phosphatase NrnA [Coriobacteriia bacterium]
MALSPQTNTTLERVAQVLRDSDNVVIAGHVSPDGDCVGSQLALMHALRGLGKTVTCTKAKDDALDAGICYLPGADEIVYAGSFKGRVGAFVAVDVPNADRMMPAQWKLHEKAAVTITVDHHEVPECVAEYNYVDPDSTSASLLVWKLAGLLGQQTKVVAQCAYTGLMTDSGSFRNQNTNVESFQLAAQMLEAGADPNYAATSVFQSRSMASVKLQGLVVDRLTFACDGQFAISWLNQEDFDRLGATKADAENMIDILRSIQGVRVACMLREQDTGVRGSYRAKDHTDVRAMAMKHHGGGHRAAAGFTTRKPMDLAVSRLIAEWEEFFAAEAAEGKAGESAADRA